MTPGRPPPGAGLRRRTLLRLGLGLPLLAAAAAAAGPARAAGAVATLDIGGAGRGGRAVLDFGGGVWRVPRVARLAEPLVAALGPRGCWRAALAWEVLAPAESEGDLGRRLAAYPLNAFLAQRDRAGGQVIVTLDAMPRYLARDLSESAAGDGPAWARSPPADPLGWAALVQAVVRHFRGLGIDAIYEVWNEPDHAFAGGVADYVALYRASVLGARRADPTARMAGPSLSDWTAGDGAGGRYIRAFLQGAAATGLPELGLKRLPVDALTYHSFNRVPARHHARVTAEAADLLAQAGYGARPVINTEWNIAAEPPYPEGDLNGAYPGAAHAGATLIAMQRAGVAAQVFQMTVDPGTRGYSAGVLTAAGTPRAAWHAFAMAAEAAQGRPLAVAGGDAVVDALAFRDGGRLRILVAVFAPTELMLARDAMEPAAIADPAVFAEVTALPRRELERYLFRDGPPPGLSPAAGAALAAGRQGTRAALAAREPWRRGGEVRLRLPAPARLVAHRVIDAATAPGAGELAREDAATNALLRDLLGRTEADLRALGAGRAEVRAYGDALARRLDGRGALAAGGAAARDLARIDADWVGPAQARLTGLKDAQAARLAQPVGQGARAGEHRLSSAAHALHLLTFQE